MENKELNLFDICVMAWRTCKRACANCGHLLAATIRLSYRWWWIVLIMLTLAAAATLYYTRFTNRWYKAEAVLLLNGPSAELTKQSIERLNRAVPFSEVQNNVQLLGFTPEQARRIKHIETFDVIDCLADSVPDYIDWKGKATQMDTMIIHMPNRVAVRLRIKEPDLLPTFENALLAYLNNQPQFQATYTALHNDLERESLFCHTQMEKLDSLTTSFYFEQGTGAQNQARFWTSGILVGSREIRLFLDEIQAHLQHMKRVDNELAMATAPVVVLDHFSFNPHAVNGRIKTAAVAFMFAWLLACLIAAGLENRKQIITWLKQK